MSTSNELRVFISSTFRDLQEEREHLVKKIFPQIRALCRERGVTFTEIDLRWGITEEEAEDSGVIRICLEEINQCRPYFIGILGERYGWIPPARVVDSYANEFPAVAGSSDVERSITELEIIHGVLENPAMAHHAHFYFRDPGATPPQFVDTDPSLRDRLLRLKQRIRTSGFPVREDFASPVDLGEAVERDLRSIIDAEFPASEAPSELDVQRRAHAAFAASRTQAYIADETYLAAFDHWLGAGTTPLVITGVSGLGKSSLVAHLADRYRSAHPEDYLIEYYVGAGESGSGSVTVMRFLIAEFRERFGIDEEVPSTPEELEQSFPNWLFRAEHHARQIGISVVIAIDAVNQLDEADRRMAWLPKTIPAGIRLVISTTPGECEDRLASREWHRLDVLPLEREDARQRIVAQYLGGYRKALTAGQMRNITSDIKGSSPLYLRVVAEELRLYGEHETIDNVIDRYRSAENLDAVFMAVLERMENDYGEASVNRLLSVIWGTRTGVSETELVEITGLSRLELSRLLLALDYHLVRRDGLFGFFHDYLRRAVERRYLGDDQNRHAIHLKLAEYFERGVRDSIAAGGTVSVRMASELAYQLHAAGEQDRLVECLSTMPVFIELYFGQTEYELLRYWSSMGNGIDIAGAYRRGIADWTMVDERVRTHGIGAAASLLERLGNWSAAVELWQERLAVAIENADPSQEAFSRRSLGWLLQLRGEYGEAQSELTKALELWTELGDRMGVSSANAGLGVLYSNLGEYDRALECYQRHLSICEELGDRRNVSGAMLNIGVVFFSRGEYERALECFERQLSIGEETGDRGCIVTAYGSIGTLYHSRGDYDRALDSLQRCLNISEELGDRRTISGAIANMGTVYADLGEFDRALDCYQRWFNISEELEDRRGMAIAQGNMGNTYVDLGDYDRALDLFTTAATEHRRIGFRYGLTYWLSGTARALLDLVEGYEEMPPYLPRYVPGAERGAWRLPALHMALEQAEECVDISKDLPKPDTLFEGSVALARVQAAQGNSDGALHLLSALLLDAADDGQRAELNYRLWKLNATTDEGAPMPADHRTEALRVYQSLVETTPKREYRMRIEELGGG